MNEDVYVTRSQSAWYTANGGYPYHPCVSPHQRPGRKWGEMGQQGLILFHST